MQTIKVKSGQTLFDIALQCYGSVEGVYQLISDNNLTSLTDLLPVDTELVIDTTKIINQQLVDYYDQEKINVCSSIY